MNKIIAENGNCILVLTIRWYMKLWGGLSLGPNGNIIVHKIEMQHHITNTYMGH